MLTKQKPEIGDLVISKKCLIGSKPALVIASRPSNSFVGIQSFNNYSMVYYVLSSEGDVEGPLFHSEIKTV